MVADLSTFSSKARRLKMLQISAGLLLVSFTLWHWAGPIGIQIANQLGNLPDKLFKGRIPSSAEFVADRLRDLSWLLASAVLLGIAAIILWHQVRIISSGLRRTLVAGFLLFVILNLFTWSASQTASFWLALYASSPTFKDTSFNIERHLLAESKAERRFAVIGSSQAASEVDCAILNKRFYPSASFSMLHFAGAQASDFLVFMPYLRSSKASDVICYVSQQSIYPRTSGHTYLPLLTSESLVKLWECGLYQEEVWANVRFGILGMAIPSFRIRRGFSTAFFGPVAEDGVLKSLELSHQTEKSLNEQNESPEVAIDKTGAQVASVAADYLKSHSSEFQKRCLRLFLAECEELNLRVHFIVGQVHPQLDAVIPVEVQNDFNELIDELPSHQSLHLIRGELPRHQSNEYSDWMHIHRSSRNAFTHALANVLEPFIGIESKQKVKLR
jgi:hypothetical protein